MRRTRTILLVTLLMAIGALGSGAVAAGCSSEPELCRFDPECGGGLGAFCNDSGDCDDGFCCLEETNCGGGMCTLHCDSDGDCPEEMGCMHELCFFLCDSTDDCADGQSCEHGRVCEWP